MDKISDKQPRAFWPVIVIGVLVIALLGSIIWFSTDLRSLYRTGALGSAGSRIRHPHAAHVILAPAQIQDWMTFRYVEHIFNLPTAYLPTALGITEANYLNSTLSGYAEKQGLTAAAFTQSVRDAVAAFQPIQPSGATGK